MRNEREKNEEKIRRVRWMYKEGGFEGSMGVYRELFGYFNIMLRWELNGHLRMGIENRGYPEFNRPAEEYDGEKDAAEELEATCRLYLTLRGLPVRGLTPEQAAELLPPKGA